MAEMIMPAELDRVHVSDVDARFRKMSGVYFLFNDGAVVYVGQSSNILTRIGEHISDRRKKFDQVAAIPCVTLNRAWLEERYIKLLKPRYNGRNIDDFRPQNRRRRGARGRSLSAAA